MAAKSDAGELKELQKWLLSYDPKELFTKGGDVVEQILKIIPEADDKKLGQRKETYAAYEEIEVPEWKKYGVEKGTQASCMLTIGKLLDQTLVDNPHSVRVFSPDELVSNKLDTVFTHTGRNFQWDEFANARGGRVIEILSEHTCQGFLQGYTLTGRVGVFPSYESFLGIIHTMMVQYSKFNKMVRSLDSSPHKPNILLTKTRPGRLNGEGTSTVSITSRRAPGRGRSTTASLTRTHPSSVPCSRSSRPPRESTSPPTPTVFCPRSATASGPRTTST